ncbi:MAG: putative DNA-binding domain-containing protein [Aestuariivirga sp.]
MSDLETLQNRMTASILGGPIEETSPELHHGGRLSIFRNNTFLSLTRSLMTTFPVTVRLADERFFAYAAHEFISFHPPGEARLSVYGRNFPSFLARFPACRGYPIIAEMAAFEWAIQSCLNDTEQEAAPISAMRSAQNGVLTQISLQPNLRFIVSRWPLIDIWAGHRNVGEPSAIQFSRSPCRAAILRSGDDIRFIPLDTARLVFWKLLARDVPLEAAAARALVRDRLFDLVRETMLLFRCGLVTRVSTTLNPD